MLISGVIQKFLWIVVGFIQIIWYFGTVSTKISCNISHLSWQDFLVYGEICIIAGCYNNTGGHLIFTKRRSEEIALTRLPCSSSLVGNSNNCLKWWFVVSWQSIGTQLYRKLLSWSCPGKSLMSCWRRTAGTHSKCLNFWRSSSQHPCYDPLVHKAGFVKNWLLKQRSYHQRRYWAVQCGFSGIYQ